MLADGTLVAIVVGLAAVVAGMSGAWSPCGFAMIESLTPVLCGGRRRRVAGLGLFAAGAIGSSAALGAVLGLAGSGMSTRTGLLVLAGLALAGAARDAGVIRVDIPQRRGQVPEPWRRVLPVWVWTPAYGAMLGLGVLTFQVVTTFWVAAGGALALGRPGLSAACMAMFGVGRVLMVVIPALVAPRPAEVVQRIAPAVGAVRRVNVAVLALLAVLALGSATAAAQPAPAPLGSFDPSAGGGVVARTEGAPDGTSVVVTDGRVTARIPGASSPAVNGDLVAYATADGVALARWRTGEVVGRVPGPVTRPALDWPYLAYVRSDRTGRTLVLRDLRTGSRRRLMRVGRLDDIGRPVMRSRVLVWAVAAGSGSRLYRMRVPRGRPVLVLRSPRFRLITGASTGAGRLAWIEARGNGSDVVVVSRLDGSRRRVVHRLGDPGGILWGTAVTARHVYVTSWRVASRRGRVVRVPLG